MKIEIDCIRKNEDGSADVIVHTDEKGTQFLVERGLLDVLREAIHQKENEMNDEDQAWEEAQKRHDIQERNKAAMGAWNAAGMFVTENADKLGRISLREAFERGFLEGYKFAKEK